MVRFVIDMVEYLISVSKGHGTVIRCHPSMTRSQEPIQIQLYLIRVIIRRYLQLQIFVQEMNNLIKFHSTVWIITFVVMTVTVNYASVKSTVSSSTEILYIVYMPMCACLLNLTTYLNLGMIVDLALLPENLIAECRHRIKFRRNKRLLDSLFKFRLKVGKVNVKRSFVTVYFKTCLDGTVTLLLARFK